MSVEALMRRPHPALIARYDGRAPRYTSYPTAMQFTPEVTGPTYRGWLAGLPGAEPVSLYAHVPLCSRLCWYCGCNTRVVNRREPVSDYVAYLLREIAVLETALPARLRASALHFGGGTPNTLSVEELAAVFGALRDVFSFEAEAEIAAELDPAGLTRDWIKAAASHGLSRASLGVQTLDPRVQAAVNRAETFDEIAARVSDLRDYGVGSVNLDLMYGLPFQTTASVLDTAEQVLSIAPERIALFGYAHVPWMKGHQKLIDETVLPGAAERLDQSEAAAERFAAAGYVRIGIDHFALPTDDLAIALQDGRLRRNFQGYTADSARTLLGVGASAIGSLPQGYVQNVTQELGWRSAIDAGELPVARGVATTRDDRFRAEVIEHLMCRFEVDLAAVADRHGCAIESLSASLNRLQPFVADGLLVRRGCRLAVTEEGRLLVRSISACFDAYFEPEAARHSRAL